MSSAAESPVSGSRVQNAPGDDGRPVGVVTRAVSWMLDAVVINAVAIISGLGVQLFLSIFPISSHLGSVLKPIAAVIYVVWCAAYFVLFWSWTGQTLGARAMQIRLLTANRATVKPARAVVRWVGMNLAMLPLFAGFVPILFGRRGFPDWLARTVVLWAPPLSVVEARPATLRTARDDLHRGPPAISPGSEPSASASGDGGSPPLATRERAGPQFAQPMPPEMRSSAQDGIKPGVRLPNDSPRSRNA